MGNPEGGTISGTICLFSLLFTIPISLLYDKSLAGIWILICIFGAIIFGTLEQEIRIRMKSKR